MRKHTQFILLMITTFCANNSISAQTIMWVHNNNGESTAYPIEEIVRMEFSLDTLAINEPERLEKLAKAFRLLGNYPNPFNPSTSISYSLNALGLVEIRIFDVTGREVVMLMSEQKGEGDYQAIWNGRNSAKQQVSAGIYFYQLSLNDEPQTKKMLLIK